MMMLMMAMIVITMIQTSSSYPTTKKPPNYSLLLYTKRYVQIQIFRNDGIKLKQWMEWVCKRSFSFEKHTIRLNVLSTYTYILYTRKYTVPGWFLYGNVKISAVSYMAIYIVFAFIFSRFYVWKCENVKIWRDIESGVFLEMLMACIEIRRWVARYLIKIIHEPRLRVFHL